jgi:hypothetical protein
MTESPETLLSRPRFQFRLRKLFALTAAVGVVCSATILAWRLANEIGGALDFGGDRTAENLTYEEFSSAFGAGFDPQGAGQISHRILATRDSYDQWTKMTIAADDYAALIERFAKHMEDPEFVSYQRKMAGSVEKTETNDPAFPADRADPAGPAPAWWTPPSGGLTLTCTRWDVQVSDSNYDGRAKGWWWLYERSTQMLWIWEWNRQHHHLRRRGKD